MGQVFLGVSPGGRPVAVKAIRAEFAADPQFRVRFGREVDAARRVSGVFTAHVVDADIDGPVAWLATSYVQGPSLTEAVESHGPLPERSLLALAAGLAESLNAIHAAGVVHRDLKPSNVLLAEDGPRVIDFGISRAAESTALTQTGLVIGSPGFMSPEQAMGGEVGPPSDIFSLGAVLAFAATGQGPFGTGTTAALVYRVVHGAPQLDLVPAAMRSLIGRCLAKDPAERPTAAALLAEGGTLQPVGNWLPDSIIGSSAGDTGPGAASAPRDPAPAGPAAVLAAAGSDLPPGSDQAATQTTGAGLSAAASTADSQELAPAGAAPTTTSGSMPLAGVAGGQRPLGTTSRPRHRLWRPLVLAWVLGVLLVASGAAAFALTSFTGHPSTPLPSQPAADTSSQNAPTSGGRTASGAASPSASRSVSSAASTSPYGGTSSAASTYAPSSTYTSTSPRSASPSPSPSASVRTSTSPSPTTPTPTSTSPTTSTSPATSTPTSPSP
jgi:eukaryotic-like serine/threonine-protein kinase